MDEKDVKRVCAQQFVLQDAQGVERAALGLSATNEPTLVFRDSQGDVRMSVEIDQNNPRITLSYAGGAGSIEIEANQRLNSAGIVISGAQGQVQALIGILGDGTPILGLLDASGKPILLQPATPDSGAPAARSQQFDWDALLRKSA